MGKVTRGMARRPLVPYDPDGAGAVLHNSGHRKENTVLLQSKP